METLDYWTPQDALAFRCTVAQVGTLKPLQDAQGIGADGLRTDVALARSYAPRALRALVRVMETEGGYAAVQAAREILLRAYGPPQTGLSAPGALPVPDWIGNERLAYRNAPNGPRIDDPASNDLGEGHAVSNREGRAGQGDVAAEACLRQAGA
jgi:hypothetical protein